MELSLFSFAILSSSLLVGLVPTLLDGTRPLLQSRLALEQQPIEWSTRIFYLTWLPCMPLAGWMLDHVAGKELHFFGLLATVIGVAWLGLIRSAASMHLNAAFLGIAYSCLTTTTVHYMASAFFATDGTQHFYFASLNLGFVAVGAGALIGPWIIQSLDFFGGYRQGLLYTSVASMVPGALSALSEREHFLPPGTAIAWNSLITNGNLLTLAVVILAYFALENSLEFWPDQYLKQLGYEGKGFQAATTIFWLAFIATRALAAWWLFEHPGHGWSLTILLVVLSAIVLGNLVGGYEIGSGSFGFWLVGACYGPLLPGLLGMAFDICHQPLPTAMLGIFLALSGLDTLLMRPLLRWFGRDQPARSAMRVPTVLALIIAVTLLALSFLRE